MPELRTGSLCSGYAGLEIAVHAVLGGSVAFVAENDPDASAVLAARLPGVPNLGDLAAVDWATVERVHLLTAGFPCQDVSQAGMRAGLRHGNRTGIWHEVARAIAEMRPPLVLLENVPGLLSARGDEPTDEHLAAERARVATDRLLAWLKTAEAVAKAKGDDRRARQCRERAAGVLGLRKRKVARCLWHERRLVRAIGTVLRSLADLGYDAVWTSLPAAAAGAPHRRNRVFVLAWTADAASGSGPGEPGIADQAGPLVGSVAGAGPGDRAGDLAPGVPGLVGGTGVQRDAADATGIRRSGDGAVPGDAARNASRGPGADDRRDAGDPAGAPRQQRRQPASGQAEGGRAHPDAGRPGRARAAADAGGAGRQGPGHAGAGGREVAAGDAAADAADSGRHALDDGSEPRAHGAARLGGDAGLEGDDRGGSLAAADADGSGRGAGQRHLLPGEPDAEGGAAADAAGEGQPQGEDARAAGHGGTGAGAGPERRDGAAADAAGDGRHQGRSGPARVVGGPDAAVGGDGAAADAAGRGRAPRQPGLVGAAGSETAGGGQATDSRGDRDAAADAEQRRRAGGPPDQERCPVGRAAAGRHQPAPADAGGARLREQPAGAPGQEAGPAAGDEPAGDRRSRADRERGAAADADSGGLAELEELDGGPLAGVGGALGDDAAGRGQDWGPYGPAIARWEAVLGRSAPHPTDPGRTGQRLSPRFVEFLMGLPEGWVTGVPGLGRNAQLKILGNGVVPQQCVLALRVLLERMVADERAEAVAAQR